jgi:hypothetical protein
MTYLLNTITGRIVAEFRRLEDAEDRLASIDLQAPRIGRLLDLYVLGVDGWQSAYAPSVVAVRLMSRKATLAA